MTESYWLIAFPPLDPETIGCQKICEYNMCMSSSYSTSEADLEVQATA